MKNKQVYIKINNTVIEVPEMVTLPYQEFLKNGTHPMIRDTIINNLSSDIHNHLKSKTQFQFCTKHGKILDSDYH